MIRNIVIIIGVLYSVAGVAQSKPALAIIIDDIGYQLANGRQAVQLPGAVTCAFLPHTPHSRELAAKAYDNGKELMVHLPMQATVGKRLGPGGLTLNMPETQFKRTALQSIASIPHASGVNNHMGSLLTRHPGAMDWLMALIKEQGDLYFVDSRTAEKSVAEQSANEIGIPVTHRDIFLDNVRDINAIKKQFRLAVKVAKRKGTAVAIGHPYPETMAVLKEELAQLEAQGIQLVPVSELIQKRQGKILWRASSFPSQKVAKNSKQ